MNKVKTLFCIFKIKIKKFDIFFILSLQIQAVVDNYKGANMDISQTCKSISETLLVRIDSKKIYENLEFDDDQKHHRATIQKKLHEMHEHIVRTMHETYKEFRTAGTDVQQHWHRKWTEWWKRHSDSMSNGLYRNSLAQLMEMGNQHLIHCLK